MSKPLQHLFTSWSRAASYPVFAWICILMLPLVLNLLIGLNQEFRSSLGEYYGFVSLFLMFQFSLGFCTIFLSTMLVSSVGRSEIIEQIRLTSISARELLNSLLRVLLVLLGPPALVFILLMLGWMFFQSDQALLMRSVGIIQSLMFVSLLAAAQLSTILLISCGLGRNVFWFVLPALPLQILLTAGAVFLLITASLPWWSLPLLSLGFVVALHQLATYNLNRLWPPQ